MHRDGSLACHKVLGIPYDDISSLNYINMDCCTNPEMRL